MGNLLTQTLTNVIASPDCEAFYIDFPNNLHKISLPYLIFDGLNLTCKPNINNISNIVANLGVLVGLVYINKTEVLSILTGFFPTIFSQDPAQNAAIFEYILINAILFIYGAINAPIDTHEQIKELVKKKGYFGAIWQCMISTFGCVGAAIDTFGNAYGRGGGYPWKFGDGWSLDKAKARCLADNPDLGCSKWGAIYYKNCRPGYKNWGCCVCVPN